MKRIAFVALAAMLTVGSFANGNNKHHAKKHAKQDCTNCTKTKCTSACKPQCHQMTCKVN
jgi:ferredoxin-like protein FixX